MSQSVYGWRERERMNKGKGENKKGRKRVNQKEQTKGERRKGKMEKRKKRGESARQYRVVARNEG